MLSYRLFIEPDIMCSHDHVKKILEFITSTSTRITFQTNMYHYNLSKNEYNEACSNFNDYFQREDEKRRARLAQDLDYRNKLSDYFQTEKDVFDYLDQLHQSDLKLLKYLKDDLKELMKSPSTNSNPLVNPHDCDSLTSKFLSLPKDAYQSSEFTLFSRCTIGGLCMYKVYTFSFTDSMKSFLLNLEEIFSFVEFDDINTLEDPHFYSSDTLIFSVCNNDRSATLYLSEEQYNIFRLLEVPYFLC